MKINLSLAIFLSGLSLAACTYERDGPPVDHYQEFQSRAPQGNTVFVCHAYGCQKQTPIKFGQEEINKLASLMRKTKKANTASEERRAVAYAIGWMESYAGQKVGTSSDRPGMDFDGSGDPTQLDCVDESTNTTSYLLILERNNLLKFHTVGRPFSRGNVLLGGVSKWPHWTAVLWETSNKKKWAVDSWIGPNGENPAIVEADKWYLNNLDALPKPKT